MDKPPYNKANRSSLADQQLPGAQMHPREEEDLSAPSGCPGVPGGHPTSRDGRTAQRQMAAPACHTHTQQGGLGGGQGYRLLTGPPSLPWGCQFPLPPSQGGPALSQQNRKVFYGHLLIKAALFFSITTRTELGEHPRPGTILTAHSNVMTPCTTPGLARIPRVRSSRHFPPSDVLMLVWFFSCCRTQRPPQVGAPLL